MFSSSQKTYKLLTCTKPALQITRIRAERADRAERKSQPLSDLLEFSMLRSFSTWLHDRKLPTVMLKILTPNKTKKSLKHTINYSFCGKTVLPAFLIVQVRVIRGKNGLNAIILTIKTYITLFRGSHLLVILNITTETFDFVKKSNSYGIDGEILVSFTFFLKKQLQHFFRFPITLSQNIA